MNKIKFAIEFGGFYDSVHSSIIEDQIEFSGIDYEEVGVTIYWIHTIEESELGS